MTAATRPPTPPGRVTLDAAYAAHPDRFRLRPVPPKLPDAAWINQPSREALIQSE